jgi:hypothetical protein
MKKRTYDAIVGLICWSFKIADKVIATKWDVC